MESWVGERGRARNRVTRAIVVLVDTHEEPVWLEEDAGRWATVCDTHATLVFHPTLRLARDWLHFPQGWCDDCRALAFPEARA